MICLYVLKLEENKYYVGITRDLDERLRLHREGEGAKWTMLYPPVKVLFVRVYGTRQDALKADLANLSQKMTELDMMVKQHHKHLGLKPLVVQEDQERESGAVEPGEAVIERGVTAKKKKPKDIEIYDNSLAYFKEEKFEDALDGFKSFLDEYPKSDRADNAQFWIGECYMALKQYEQAILAYQDVIKKFPKGNKVPNALLRQAGAFLEIKDKTSSRLLLKKVIEKYPESSEAESARKKLKTLQ